MKLMWGASLAALTMAAAPAMAEESADNAAGGSEDSSTIIVNGQKAIGDGQVATTARIGILGDQDVLDTPFSTSSFTSEFIANQQANSLGEIIENDPSIRPFGAAPRGSSWTASFFVRGFNSNIPDNVSVNGLFGLVSYAPSINYVERLDIFKGPSAFLSGAPGAVGGTFNFAPKRASAEGNRQVEVSYLSDSLFGGSVDLGQRFGKGRFGLRATGVYRSGDNAIDGGSFKQKNASLGLDYASETVRIGADFIYEDTWNRGYLYNVNLASSYPTSAPLPAVVDGSHRGQPEWMGAGYKSRMGLVRGEWDFAQDWTLGAAYGHSFATGGYDSYCTVEMLDAAGNARCSAAGYYSEEKNDSADISVRGKFATGPISHSLTFGANYLNRVGSNNGGTAFATTYYFNFYDAADRPGRPTYPEEPATLLASKRRVSGFFAGDTMGIADDLVTLTVGARKTTIRTLSYNRTGAQTSASDKGKWTPLVAGTIQPTETLTIYGNYIQALEPGGIAGGTAANAGTVFPPLVSKQIEGGAKFRFGGLLATAAWFRIDKANQYLDTRTTPPIYVQDGLQRNEGVELALAGTLLPGLNVIAGTAWIDAKQMRTAGGTFDGKDAPGVPDFSARLNLDYRLPWIEGVTVSGGYIYTGKSVFNNLNTRMVPGWDRFDLGAAWKFAVSGTDLTARFSVENVTNNKYWVSSGNNSLYQGTPRSLALSLTADF
ncbi:MAG: TonB-dependent siderophore receptor [Novosphingobium sp.]